MFNKKNKCCSCGKETNVLYYKAGGLQSLTVGWCKECKEKKDKESLELLEAIKNGEDINRFL